MALGRSWEMTTQSVGRGLSQLICGCLFVGGWSLGEMSEGKYNRQRGAGWDLPQEHFYLSVLLPNKDPGFKHCICGHGHFEDVSPCTGFLSDKQEVFLRIELN